MCRLKKLSQKIELWFKVSNDTIDLTTDAQLVDSITAAEITVKSIIDNYPPPYRLMCSGGVDSQAMLFAWSNFGKDFIPTTVIYNEGLNDYDVQTLKKQTDVLGLNTQFVNFDLINFYQKRFFELADQYQITSPQFAAHLGMTEDLDGTIIFSGDRIGPNHAAIFSENLCIYRASFDRPIVPYFFMHTPEIAYSMIFDLRKLEKTEFEVVPETRYLEKVKNYHHTGFPVIPQNKKYNGFEKIKELYDTEFKHLVTPKMRFKYRNKPSNRVFDLLLRYPYHDRFKKGDFKYLFHDIATQ